VFIQEILHEQNLRIKDLDAIAVGKGPGSYTGLRIGVSTAKGLCFGSNKPLIAIGTLKIMAQQLLITPHKGVQEALQKNNSYICPMIDARRMEVYTSIYTTQLEQVENVSAKIIDIDSFRSYFPGHTMIFIGSGMEKCRNLLDHPNAVFVDNIHPHASALAQLAEDAFQGGIFEDLAYFEPFYLKDFVATVPKKRIGS
jgi:tRNA threonylcarbamoyladenosine biosynthesis protein TsaB